MSDFESYVPRQRFLPTLSFAPDGARIAYSCNSSGQYNLWVADLDGTTRQLTTFTDNAVREVAWSPDGSAIAFAADRHGNEQHQIHLIDPAGGAPRALTEVPDRQFDLAGIPFTADGSTLVYTGNDRDEASPDVLVHDLRSGEVRRVQTAGGMWGVCSVSPDGRWLLVVSMLSNTRSELFTVDLHDPAAELVRRTPDGEPASHWGGPWSADGTAYYDRTDAGADFRALRLVRLADGSTIEVAAPEWEVEGLTLSADGGTLAWSVNEGGRSQLRVRRDGVDVALPAIPDGVVQAMALSPDGTRLALVFIGATRPSDLALVDLAAGTFRYLTDSRPPALTAAEGIGPELIAYPTHDGRDIPAWLYRPRGDGPFPFLLSIHGGPEAQERPQYAYAGLYQYLLANGIGVLAPNIRGSAGYGTAYQRLIYRDWGGAELGDLEHAALYLRGRADVDPDRMGVFGGSFGGFATLSCLSRLPQYWAAGVSIVGPCNLVTFARAVPPTWRAMVAEWVGDPDTDAELLAERSPITYADQIVAPLMVVQGANDPRVVQAESDQIVASLRARGVEVHYDVYHDEGHGFTNRANEIKALTDVGHFLTTHLIPRA